MNKIDTPIAEPLLTPDEAACRLRISRSYLYELMKAGRLRSMKLGKLRRIPASEVDSYIESVMSGDQAANVEHPCDSVPVAVDCKCYIAGCNDYAETHGGFHKRGLDDARAAARGAMAEHIYAPDTETTAGLLRRIDAAIEALRGDS